VSCWWPRDETFVARADGEHDEALDALVGAEKSVARGRFDEVAERLSRLESMLRAGD
jgi:hypothetical protein